MKRVFDLRVEVDEVEQAGDRLQRLASLADATLAAVDAVNVVARRADASIRAGENADLGLTDAYVRSKTDLALAVRKPRAEIVTRGDLTILGRYPIDQRYVPASGKARGDPKRGIPAGQKQAGLQVDIRRSAPTVQGGWFTMTLRRGVQAGDNVGVFVRTGKDRVKHIYGPSPYSLARFQIGQQGTRILDDLTTEATRSVTERIDQALR